MTADRKTAVTHSSRRGFIVLMHRNITTIAILLCLCLSAAADTALTYRLTYRLTSPSETRDFSWHTAEEAEQKEIRMDDDTTRIRLVSDRRWNTRSFMIANRSEGIEVEASRSGDRILVSGIHRGTPVKKELVLEEDLPWYQTFNHQFGDFALSDEKKRQFWMIRLDTLEATRWQLKRIGSERLPIGGSQIEAVRVRLSLTGLLAPFWSADLWYRAEDGRFLRYLGPIRGPGSEEVETLLVKEE